MIPLINVLSFISGILSGGSGIDGFELLLSLLVGFFMGAILIFSLKWLNKKSLKASKENEKKYVKEKKAWNKAMKIYDRLYYCHRDDIIFDPANDNHCIPETLMEFIYS